MNLKQKKEEISTILDAMAQNSFLVPQSFSEFHQLSDLNKEYRTYSNGSRDYLCIDMKDENGETRDITANKKFTGWTISGGDILTSKSIPSQIDNIHKCLKAIYDDMHSLNTDKNIQLKRKEIRKQIMEKNKKVSEIKKEIKVLEQEIIDSYKISKN